MQDGQIKIEKPIYNDMYQDTAGNGQHIADSSAAFEEQRKEIRKEVNLTGGYISSTSGERGLINLINVSHSGLRYKLNTSRNFYPTSKMQIKFTLDDFPHTIVSREAVIRNVNGQYVSAEFCSADDRDGLSIYLEQG